MMVSPHRTAVHVRVRVELSMDYEVMIDVGELCEQSRWD